MEKQPGLEEMLLAFRQLVAIHERIAQSLSVLEKISADEARKREEDRNASKAWMQKQEEMAVQHLKDPTKLTSPAIPWQVTAMWILGIVVLLLAAVMFLIAIFQQMFGT